MGELDALALVRKNPGHMINELNMDQSLDFFGIIPDYDLNIMVDYHD
jgi:hypothetical protein